MQMNRKKKKSRDNRLDTLNNIEEAGCLQINNLSENIVRTITIFASLIGQSN